MYRLYHLSGLGVKRRRRQMIDNSMSFIARLAAPNLTRSMNFDMDALASGRRTKSLICVDDFIKECLIVTAISTI